MRHPGWTDQPGSPTRHPGQDAFCLREVVLRDLSQKKCTRLARLLTRPSRCDKDDMAQLYVLMGGGERVSRPCQPSRRRSARRAAVRAGRGGAQNCRCVRLVQGAQRGCAARQDHFRITRQKQPRNVATGSLTQTSHGLHARDGTRQPDVAQDNVGRQGTDQTFGLCRRNRR